MAPAGRDHTRARMDDVFWFVVWICIVIFAIVVAALLYSVVRFRARRTTIGRPADPRAHRPRDRLDAHPHGARDGDRDLQRDRARPE